MRYRLRTLLIVLALGPPVLAWGWDKCRRYVESITATEAAPFLYDVPEVESSFPANYD